MPAFRDRAPRTDFFTRWDDDSTGILFSRALGKLTTAFPIDGVGDLKPPFVPALLITVDNVPDGPDTTPGNPPNPTLTVTPPGTTTPIVSTIDTIGDQDYYKVTLTAGTAYEFGMYSFNGGPNAAGLTDPYLELYGSDGTTMLVSADGGADTVYNQANSGFDVLLVYTPTTSGTFYVNARAFSNSPATPNGDSVGDYELFVRQQDLNDPDIYQPYYEPTEPLYAIDWGTQVNKENQSVRNPDGDEGTRNTGNADGTPTYTTLVDIPALAAAQGKDITDKNVITIYFAKAGDVFASNDPTNPGLPPATITAVAPQDFERLAVFTSLAEFEKVADVIYLEVQDRDHADFVYTSYQGTPGPGVSLLGSMSPPDESDEGLAQFNSGDSRWNARDLAQGGFSFVTLIHEFGHGHGLAHPHDNGGHSGIMNGVEPEGAGVADYTTGDYDLNQGVFTMMSYEDGWQTSPHTPVNASTSAGYGWLGGLMAFDIAAIQDKYGVNEDYNIGDNTYTMKDVNAAGTFYYSIWDGGGIDEIVYGGARDASIDLRAASLEYEFGGGGWVSYALGIYGGFTIANGVTIENAIAGSGDDVLIGNDVANALVGGAGVDTMTGGLGDDTYYVDDLGDIVSEAVSEGTDRIATSASYALAAGSEVETLEAITLSDTNALDLTGNAFNNTIIGNNGANILASGGGNDLLLGAAGNDILISAAAASNMYGGTGDDTYYVRDSSDAVNEGAGAGADRVAAAVSYALLAGSEVEILEAVNLGDTTALNLSGNELANTVIGNAGANVLSGGGGNDVLISLGGDDALIGGAGNDAMYGGTGNDVYHVADAGDVVTESAGEGADRVATSVSYTLAAGSEVETLEAITFSATNALDLTGNALGNTIYGNNGTNTVDGKGGADVVAGLGGADTFAFTTALGGGNVDSILDFSAADDTIALDDAVFAGLGLGALGANAFVTASAAQDADDRIIYDSSTGKLYFDADGNGAGAAVQFAYLQGTPVLSASDFVVI